MTYLLPQASIRWQGQTPISNDYRDIYWSQDDGVGEKSHVFLRASQIERHWQHLTDASHFTVCEIGFGFGLNFLLTLDAWRNRKGPGLLHYISIENQPVSPSDLARLSGLLPQRTVDELLGRYPLPIRGRHVRWFGDDVRLTLVYDDAQPALKDLAGGVDAWYLDAFSPDRNGDPWSSRVFGQMFARSRPGASLTTYSVSGDVRRGLTQAGFEVSRQPGFGAKREMLSATRPDRWQATSHESPTVAVIGNGIAGAYLHEALSRRRLTTCVFEDEDPPVQVPQFAVCPSLAVRAEHRYRFSLSAFEYATSDNPHFHQSGLMLITEGARERQRWLRISEQLPDEFLYPTEDGFLFPRAGWISASQLTALTPRTHQRIHGVVRHANCWRLLDESGQTCQEADVVVVATGADRPPCDMPLSLDIIPGLALSIRTEQPIRRVRSGEVSLFPAMEGAHTLSGIYDRQMTEPSPAHVKELLDGFGSDCDILSSTMGLRATTRDRLPIVGAVPDWEQLTEHDSAKPFSAYQPGLYVLNGLGSYGANTARLSAEHIANLITGEVPAIDKRMQRSLAAERFHIRDSK